MKELKERTLKGALAKISAQGINLFVRVGSLMVLARLLDPKDFGLVAMVTAVTGVFALFRDAGLSMVTIQRPTISREEISTLFWLNMLAGTIVAALSVAIAPLLVTFYHEPRLFWVTVVLASGFLFNAAGAQHSALLQRNMRFTTISAIDIVSQTISALVGIALAMSDFEYWAIVASTIVSPAVSTLGVWSVSPWTPGLPRWGINLGAMIRLGGLATFNSLIMYVAYNLEKVLLGRFWGAESLGLYGRGYQLINIPTDGLNSAGGEVAFSALARLQSEPLRLRDYFLKGYSAIVALTVPLTISCALFANDIILIILGHKWAEVVPIFRLLIPTMLFFALINPLAWLLFSIGMVGKSVRLAMVLAPLVMASYVVGLPYGPTGVAVAYSSVLMLWLIPHIAWCVHGTVICFRDILKAASQPFISGIVAAGCAFAAQFLYGPSLSPFPRLILGGGVLMAVYLWMLLYVMGKKEFYIDLLRTMKGRASVKEKEAILGVL